MRQLVGHGGRADVRGSGAVNDAAGSKRADSSRSARKHDRCDEPGASAELIAARGRGGVAGIETLRRAAKWRRSGPKRDATGPERSYGATMAAEVMYLDGLSARGMHSCPHGESIVELILS